MTKARRFAFQAVIQIAALALFWIACVASFQLHEMLAGLAAVAVSVAFCLYVIRTLPLRFRPALRETLQICQLPWYILVDLLQITRVLVRDLLGKRAPSLFRSVPWPHVKNNGRDTARRVLAVACTTVSPNCIVIGVDCGRRQLLFHQLRADRLPAFTRSLGAEDPQ
jgi:multisubunit Na+/H+ antiporter MnhE subunit